MQLGRRRRRARPADAPEGGTGAPEPAAAPEPAGTPEPAASPAVGRPSRSGAARRLLRGAYGLGLPPGVGGPLEQPPARPKAQPPKVQPPKAPPPQPPPS